MAESFRITDFKTLANLRTKFQDRNEARSELRQIYALDTETDEGGNIVLVADSNENYLELDNITPRNIIKFLFSKRYQGTWNFFYNLTFDAEVILKTLGKVLYNYTKTRNLSFKFEGYTIHYIPQKSLSIKKGHHSSVFFDIAQYYHESLDQAYLHNIGKLPKWYLEIKSKRKSFTRYFYKHNARTVRKYCFADCTFTKQLAEHWIKLFNQAFGFNAQRWISSGYLAEKVLINNKIPLPRFSDISYDVQELAWNSYFGGRFEILKRGFIGQAYLYDINSAYPYAFANIPDITKGNWIQSDKLDKNALLGFFKINTNIPDCKYVPPFPYRKNHKVIFPSGRFTSYCTLAELKACRNPDYYTILESWQYLDNNPEYPYKEFIESIYKKRLELKQENNPIQLPLKVILNSLYGKTAQRKGNKIGNLFSPIIASTITGITRAMLYDFVQKYDIERNVVSFATDSIITTKKIEIDSEKLGDFKFENSGDDVYVLQNGIYRFNGKWKKRGIGKLGIKPIEHLDTMEKDGKLYQVFKLLRVNRLRTCILNNSLGEIGKFSTVQRLVNLNADRKRMWFEDLKDVNDGIMIDSLPISLRYFKK